MRKHILPSCCLLLLLFVPLEAQQLAAIPTNRLVTSERFTTISETNYLNQLALRGFNLDTQGLLVESLDGSTVFAELNPNAEFNPASVTKIATTFTALFKLGSDYHFETAFYSDGSVNSKTRTLTGNLVLFSTGDPVLTAMDITRLAHQVVASGVSRVTGDLVITGPFTYNGFTTTENATNRVALLLKRMGIRFSGVRKGSLRGTKIASHMSASIRDIVFYQNAHSVNQTAERLGEAVGGPRAVENFLIKEVGLAPSEVSLSHTSGLDINRITPRGTIAMLRHLVAWLNLHNMLPEDIMPVAGVDPGTLHARFTSLDSRGAIVAKTGTLPGTDGGVSSLAGILYTKDRGTILFAIFNSRGPVNTYRRMQDSLLKELIAECGGVAMISASSRRANN